MTTNPPQEPAPIAARQLTDVEFRYYCTGFYKSLKRYRTMTIIGWLVVLLGGLSFPLGWNIGRPTGIIEMGLSCATIIAGLGLVWQSISSLEAYIHIVLPMPHNGESHPLVHQVAEIMKDVDDGGWQEAYSAIKKMEEIQVSHGLRPFS